jgi:hypothetical protein
MLESLQVLLDKKGKRPQVIKDCVSLLEAEVSKKKGVMGMAIRKGFTGEGKLKEGKMMEKLVNKLLDDFIDALEPYYQTYLQSEASTRGDFADFLSDRDEAVTESLLAVTDKQREAANSKMIIVVYDKMRKIAGKNVKEAVPALGQLIQAYTSCAK